MEHKLTLVEAGAGYGKTTLLAQWCARVKTAKVGWLTLTKAEQNPSSFWRYLLAGLANLASELGAIPQNSLAQPVNNSTETLLVALLNRLAESSRELVLVLDDFQLVAGSAEVRNILTFLLDNLPARLHLVIASRSELGIALGRLRANREVLEVGRADLRFSDQEALALLRLVIRPELRLEGIINLQRRTEGWAAGLQIAAFTLNRQPKQPTLDFLDDFGGSHQLVQDYFTEEVISNLPDLLQTCLLVISLFDRFNASLCQKLLPGNFAVEEDAQTALETMSKTTGFVLPLDEEGEWFRCHRLLTGYLKARVSREFAGQIGEWHRRAADWFEQAGLMEAALNHWLTAGEFSRAASLLEETAENYLKRGEVHKVYCWLYQLPASLVADHCRLQLFYACSLALLDQPEMAEIRLKSLKNVTDEVLHKPILAIRTTLQQKDVAVSFCLEKLPEVASNPPTYWHSLVSFNLSQAYQEKGYWEEARIQWETTFQLAEQSEALNLALQALHNLAELTTLKGHLHQAVKLYRQALELATRYKLAESRFAGIIHQGLADRLYEWNELDKAEEHLNQALATGHYYNDSVLVVTSYLRLFNLRLAQGRYPAALEILQETEYLTQKYGITQLPDWILLLRARLALSQGQLKEAERLTVLISRAVHSEEWWQARTIHQARLWLALKSPEDAFKLIEDRSQQLEEQDVPFRKIKWLVLKSVVLESCGKTKAALATLAVILEVAESEGYLRTFLDEDPVLLVLLQKLPLTNYSSHLLQLGKINALATGRFVDTLLSSREINVLRLIAAGYSNQAIAEQLIISVSTVKAHVHNILSKLEAANRTEALVRARNLNLL